MKALVILALTAKSVWFTTPQPPKHPPSDPLRVFPGSDIPEKPEAFVWQVKGQAGSARAFGMNEDDGRLTKMIGTVPDGTPVTLDAAQRVGSVIYYAIPAEVVASSSGIQPKPGTKLWISGNEIKAVSLAGGAGAPK